MVFMPSGLEVCTFIIAAEIEPCTEVTAFLISMSRKQFEVVPESLSKSLYVCNTHSYMYVHTVRRPIIYVDV